MQIDIKVSASAGLTALLARGQNLGSVLERSGEAVSGYLRAYHQEMTWRGSGWMEPSLGFAEQVVAGWQKPVVSGSMVSVTNTFPLLSHKITGGTITPKNASALTIPLISAAKGKSVAQYRAESSEPLFTVGRAICQRIGERVTAIYALRQSVTQSPWPGAMPKEEALAEVFTNAAEAELEVVIKG